MRRIKKLISNFTIITLVACLFSGCSISDPSYNGVNNAVMASIFYDKNIKLNYADKENWAYCGLGENKDADLFIICPTVDMGEDGNYNMSLSNIKVKNNFLGALNMEKGIYENSTRMYAPYYRQVTFPVYSLNKEEAEKYFNIAYNDVRNAFLYYMEHYNNNKPVVLAGFSQGSDMVIRLIKEFYNNEKYNKNLVAAYCIGWRITDKDISSYPWIKMAQGKDDTGVIVSFNSEAKGIKDSLIIPSGTKTIGINPLNWKTDGTVADASENKGACFTDYEGKIVKEEEHFSGAYLDAERGSLIVTDANPSQYKNSLFPDGVYHLYDYQFFYKNLQENVSDRVKAFKNKK